MLAATTAALVAALVLAPRTASEPSGAVTPEHSLHDFGEVAMGGGLLLAQFPLAVEGAPLVTSLAST